MAKTNSTPKGNPANRTGANMKKQKKNINAGAKRTETEVKRRKKKQNLNAGAENKSPTPEVKKIELTLEDIANNKFEELAVAVAYAKDEEEKEAAVKAFTDFFNGEIPDSKKAAIKEILENRLKADDFIYGSEFIDLTGLRQYQENMFKAPEISLEDRINNAFDEMAVSVVYAKNEGDKLRAIRTFNTIIDNTVTPEDLDAVKAQVAERLKEDDFVYGSEFIDLTELRQYQDKLFEKRKVEKEFEPHSSTLEDKQPEKTPTVNQTEEQGKEQKQEKATVAPLSEQELYQALMDGINNEEIKNIKGYSKEDLQKILDTQDELLNGKDNATAFESLHENSIADLKKFANGDMTVDNDSYETMLQFIKVFGTNYKGELTPEGKAAYDKLMDLMAKDKKDKILKNKEEYQKKAAIAETVKDNANNTLAGILGGLAANAVKREKEQAETAPDFTIGMETPEEEKGNTNTATKPENNQQKEKETPIAGVLPIANNIPANEENSNNGGNPPVPPIPPSNGNDNVPETPPAVIADGKKEEKKKGWWGRLKDKVKRNWKKIAGWAAAAAAAAALLLMPKNCSGNGDAVPPQPDNGTPKTPKKEAVVKPDTITLDQDDLANGFYLERSAGFKAEQEKINFHDAEKANKADLLTIKKLLTHGDLNLSEFVRHSSSKDTKPVSVTEIAYKMRIVTQNFPNSKVAASIGNMFSGKVSPEDANKIYNAFSHVDDFGNLINNKGKIIEGIPGQKTIDAERMGPGSKEYGTQGADNNFLQVLKNHRDARNK